MNVKGSGKMWYAISFAFQLGFLIAIPIVLALLLGIWLDRLFGLTPFLMLVTVAMACVFTGYEVYHALLSIMRDNHVKH